MENNDTSALSGGGGSGNYKDMFCDNDCVEGSGGAGSGVSCGMQTQATLPSGLQTTLRYCRKHGWIGGGGAGANGIGNGWRATGGGGSGQNEY